ncbi:hypothetical protein [Micromonospora eburnea]|uniref:Uncharacterized protein n=1 Tax=Micromonospora eburnea TaxID=227316 RepID=A0A1C6V9J4_9ACTN|nr:hypothetical protein [Micromonospora eburnea]SCL62754.1 hypothetical protein GA0070604_4817 [Micromonospora eburnea]
MRREVGALAGVTALLMVNGCTPEDRAGRPVVTTASPAATASTMVDAAAVATGPEADEVPRPVSCGPGESHMIEPMPTPSGPDDVVAGPVVWRGLKAMTTGDPAAFGYQDADGGHYKVGVGVRAGATATVMIGPEARGYAGLKYGQAWEFRPVEGVRFAACPDGDTWFVGGFFVKGRRCVPLDVTAENARPVRVVVSLFAGPCPG